MSFLYNLIFGKPVEKTSVVPNPVQSIHSILKQEEQLDKKLSYTRVRIQQLLEEAKGYIQRNEKAKALVCMKQKGILEDQEKSYVCMLEKLVHQRLALEMNQMQRDTLQVMQQTNTVLQVSEATLNTEKAQDILENFEEKLQIQEDITRLFAQPLAGTDNHEQQAEEEVNKLMQEISPNHLPTTQSIVAPVAYRTQQQQPAITTTTVAVSERLAVLS